MHQNESISVKALLNVLGGGAVAAVILAAIVLFFLNIFV